MEQTHLSEERSRDFPARIRVEEVRAALPYKVWSEVQIIFDARVLNRPERQTSAWGVYLAHLRRENKAAPTHPSVEPGMGSE